MSSIKDNIYASLRKFLGKPEATEAELDQALTDQVEAQDTEGGDTSNSTDDPPSEEAKQTVEQPKKEEAKADSNWDKLFAKLDEMDERLTKVEQQPAGQETSYEEKGAEKGGDKTDRYLCPNTRKALGLN